MIIDCHVHVSAATPEHGFLSPRLLNSVPFRSMRWKLGIVGNDESSERALEAKLIQTIDQTTLLQAAVVLAFDGVYSRDGQFDRHNTHLYVTNDYVIELSQRHPKVLFGASVHPYRKDAIVELERCVQRGAVLMKWLPIVQNMQPDDPACIPFYEALSHHGLPLLSHTGAENALPNLNHRTADPMVLEEALKRGVKVIMAHCGTRLAPWEKDYTQSFMRLARQYEHCYGDTAALNLPNRWRAFDVLMGDPVVRTKLLHGSDWPILSLPPLSRLGWSDSAKLLREPNWMRRDVLIKQKLGLGDDYWHRAARVLRTEGRTS